MALGSSLGPDNTMVSCGSSGHPDQHGHCGGMAFKHQYGHRLQPRLRAFLWPLVLPWAMAINSDPDYGRTMDPDMGHSSSLGLGVTMAPDSRCPLNPCPCCQ